MGDKFALAEVAAVYRSAVADGDPAPTKAVAARLGVAYSTASKKVMAARWAGLLPVTTSGRINAFASTHRCVTGRLSSEPDRTFRVCRECLTPWPCADAPKEDDQ